MRIERGAGRNPHGRDKPEGANTVRPLFRPEALEARQEKALGTVLFVQPLSTTILTLVAASIALSLILFAFWGEYTRKARVSGYLVSSQGIIKVYSREAGTIVEKHVAEGRHISKGDVLFVVSMERRSRETVEAQGAAMAQLDQRRTSLRTEVAQHANIAEIELQGVRRRIAAIQAEVAQLGKEMATQDLRVANAQSAYGRYRELGERELLSRDLVDEKQKDLLDQQGKLQAMQRSLIGLGRERDTLQAQAAAGEIKAQTEQAVLERGISTLAQERTEYESRRSFVVTAPADGIATAVLAEPGQTANPAQPLVSILPAGAALVAHLLVPSHSIGFLARNQSVALRYQAFPHQRFGSYQGRVSQISRALILPNETSLPLELKEPAYRVTVALDSQSVIAYGRGFPLQSGMLLDADIWLDRRKLYQWLLDPLYSALGRV